MLPSPPRPLGLLDFDLFLLTYLAIKYNEMLILMLAFIRALYMHKASLGSSQLSERLLFKAALLILRVVHIYSLLTIDTCKHTTLSCLTHCTLVSPSLILDYPLWGENRVEKAWSCSSSESCTRFSNYAAKLSVNSLFSCLLILVGNVPKCLFFSPHTEIVCVMGKTQMFFASHPHRTPPLALRNKKDL